MQVIKYSLIIPVYKNSASLAELCQQVSLLSCVKELEVIFVVDGSPDDSFTLLKELLPHQEFQSTLILLSRNFGSFAAIRYGLECSKGQYSAVMAADLQEPINLVSELFERLNDNRFDIVFGCRISREDGLSSIFSHVFWAFYRRYIVPGIPSGGVDIFACNQCVKNNLLKLHESNTSLISQLFWLGYRRDFIKYGRQKRVYGKSSWSLQKKFKYLSDSILAFSDLPIRILMITGSTGLIISVSLSIIILVARFSGKSSTVPGYTPIMLVILGMGSILIIGQAILGSYVWRILSNTQGRPLAVMQQVLNFGNQIESNE